MQTLRFYRALWQEVCVVQGWANLPELERDKRRAALHTQLGLPTSSKDFTTRDLTRWKTGTARLRKAHAPAMQADDSTVRAQLLWRIRRDQKAAGFPDAYLVELARSLFGLGCWDELATDDLTNFRNTLHNRAKKAISAARKAAREQAENAPF